MSVDEWCSPENRDPLGDWVDRRKLFSCFVAAIDQQSDPAAREALGRRLGMNDCGVFEPPGEADVVLYVAGRAVGSVPRPLIAKLPASSN
jgi:hypothetical protein